MSSTIAWRWPTSRLKSVDLPTFGRPTMASTGFTWGPRRVYGGGVTSCVDAPIAFRQQLGDVAHHVVRGFLQRAAAERLERLADTHFDGPPRPGLEHHLRADDAHRQDGRAAA